MKTLLAALLAPVLMIAVPPTSVGSITIFGVEKQCVTEKIQYTGIYPQFKGIQDRQRQTDLNNQMREWQNCAMARAKAAVLTLPAGDRPAFVVEGIYTYEVKRNSGGLASLLFDDYLFAGGAHGIDVKTGLTFSTVSGKVLSLADFFESDASYKEVLNRLIKQQLQERGLESQLLAPFTGLTGKETFYITDSDLVIVVGDTEWFPHSMGTVEFPMSFSELQMYLKEGLLL